MDAVLGTHQRATLANEHEAILGKDNRAQVVCLRRLVSGPGNAIERNPGLTLAGGDDEPIPAMSNAAKICVGGTADPVPGRCILRGEDVRVVSDDDSNAVTKRCI